MNKRIVFRRMFGAVLLYILIMPSVAFGYSLSAKLYMPPLDINTGLYIVLYIIIRLTAFMLGLFWFYKLLRPYSKNFLLATKVGDNLLFDEGKSLFGRFTVSLALSLIGASILIGFGAFGLFAFLARLVFLLLQI